MDSAPAADRPAAEDIVGTAEAGPAALRGGLLRTGGFVLGLLLGLASAPLIVRHLGDAEFGRYSAVLAVIAIVSGLTEGGINTVALRELAAMTDRADRDRAMSDLLGLRLLLSCGGITLAVCFVIVAGYDVNLTEGTLLAGLGMLFAVTQTLLASVLQSKLRFGWITVVDLVRQVTITGLIVALVLLGAGVVSFLAASIPGGILALAMTVVLVRGETTLRPSFNPRHWGTLLRETMVFALAVAVNTLYLRVILVIMALLATAEQTGFFAISFRVMEILVTVPLLLLGSAFPIVARAANTDQERFAFASRRLFELSVYAGSLGTLCLVLLAPFAIEVLTGSSDHPSVVVLQIQSLAIALSFVAVAATYMLLGLRRHRQTLFANCLSLAVAVILAFVLIPPFAAEGAASAAVVAELTLAISSTLLLVRRGGPRLPYSSLPVALVAAGCGCAAGTLAAIHPLADSAIAGAVFLAVLALLGRFPPEAVDLLRNLRSRVA